MPVETSNSKSVNLEGLNRIRLGRAAHFRLLVESVRDYAIFALDPDGNVLTWNAGAERIKGYKSQEIIGKHFSCFYPDEKIQSGFPAQLLLKAAEEGRLEDEGWRVRKDGSRFWASVVITALPDQDGNLIGFGKVTRDLTERKEAEETIARQAQELLVANQGLETFCYTVSHDLRAPLRSINGFTQLLHENCGDQLDSQATDYLQRVRACALRMEQLINDLLQLSRATLTEMKREVVDLSKLARSIAAELTVSSDRRVVEFVIESDLKALGDERLLRIALENLFNNAWKFMAKQRHAKIEFGISDFNGSQTYFIRDNGAGFDMTYADKLFGAFQRLHNEVDYPGSGVGLATVQRIIHRHGGRVWAESVLGEGASFYFTLPMTG